MKTEKALSLRTQRRLVDNICLAVDKLVDYQFRLHFDVLHDAVCMQTEANRLRFKVKQLMDGTYEPEPIRLRKTRKDGQPDRRRGCKGGPAARARK